MPVVRRADPLVTGSPNGTPGWLPLDCGFVYTVLHESTAVTRRDTAVLLLPPFGWDEVCSYRSRRQWAIDLATAGFVTARIDLPGSGDSLGMPRDPELTQRWLDAVLGAISWLQSTSRAERIAVIGIGLGGILAFQALAAGAPIDDLVLWSVPARGRTYLRELEMHSKIASAPYAEDDNGPASEDGTVGFTGFAISAETKDALRSLRLGDLSLPDLTGTAALLIGRTGLGVDKELMSSLTRAGAAVQTDEGRDYAALVSSPVEPKMPHATFASTIRWLEKRASPSTAAQSVPIDVPNLVSSITFEQHGRVINETLLSYQGITGRMGGVLSEPIDGNRAPFCVVLLNAGPIRRIGPSRLWVEMARRWAARGVPVLRMDLEAMGDSDGDGLAYADGASLYAPVLDAQATGLINRLQEDGVAERFVFAGLCLSAYWGWQAAISDPRVLGTWLINMYAMKYTRALVAERDRATTKQVLGGGLAERIRDGVTREDIRRGITAFRPSLGWVTGSEELAQARLIESSLDALRDRGTDVLIMLGQDEPMYRQLERLGLLDRIAEWPNVTFERIPSRDHNVRALWLQDIVHRRLDAALDEILVRVSPGSAPQWARSGSSPT